MLEKIQIAKFGLCLTVVLSTHSSWALDPSDPCSERKFCGNLTIIYNGAGENLGSGERKGKYPAAKDTVDYLAALARKHSKNSKILLLSSDTSPAVAAAIASAEERLGTDFTHLPTSRPAFEEYLNSDTKLNAMKRAFAADSACKELMPKNPNEDIAKFIKVDVMVASHSRGQGVSISLPIWPNDSDKGGDDRHSEIVDSSFAMEKKASIVSKDFDQLRNAFSKAVFHVLPITCDAADVAEMILPHTADSCACSVSYTDSGILSVRDTAVEYGVLVDTVLVSKGAARSAAPSLTSFTLPLQNYNRWKLMRGTPTGVGKG